MVLKGATAAAATPSWDFLVELSKSVAEFSGFGFLPNE